MSYSNLFLFYFFFYFVSGEIDLCNVNEIFHQIVSAVDYLHKHRLMHRDLKVNLTKKDINDVQ